MSEARLLLGGAVFGGGSRAGVNTCRRGEITRSMIPGRFFPGGCIPGGCVPGRVIPGMGTARGGRRIGGGIEVECG